MTRKTSWLLLPILVVFTIYLINASNGQTTDGEAASEKDVSDEKAGDSESTFGEPGAALNGDAEEPEEVHDPKSPFAPPPGATPLSETDQVWIDLKRKMVFVDGKVVLREGKSLEMFACPANTKEHESVVAVNAAPVLVHVGLLRIGAKSGHPVQVEPEYKAATGTKIDVLVLWYDAEGRRHQAPAQKWIRHVRTGKQLAHPWVFAGSGFWVDERTGEKHYHGNSGDFICVANFPTATLDLPIPSSQANADLEYEPFTENVPPVGTAVRLVLRPRLHDMPDVED